MNSLAIEMIILRKDGIHHNKIISIEKHHSSSYDNNQYKDITNSLSYNSQYRNITIYHPTKVIFEKQEEGIF